METSAKNTITQPFDAKDTTKIESLKKYIESSPTFDVIEHPRICKSFDLPYLPNVFKDVYHARFLECIKKNAPITAATISKLTGLTHKYCCQIKRQLVDRGLIYVSHLGKCPTTGSNGVQFLVAYG